MEEGEEGRRERRRAREEGFFTGYNGIIKLGITKNTSSRVYTRYYSSARTKRVLVLPYVGVNFARI